VHVDVVMHLPFLPAVQSLSVAQSPPNEHGGIATVAGHAAGDDAR
jgi:hypothetical protein